MYCLFISPMSPQPKANKVGFLNTECGSMFDFQSKLIDLKSAHARFANNESFLGPSGIVELPKKNK